MIPVCVTDNVVMNWSMKLQAINKNWRLLFGEGQQPVPPCTV